MEAKQCMDKLTYWGNYQVKLYKTALIKYKEIHSYLLTLLSYHITLFSSNTSVESQAVHGQVDLLVKADEDVPSAGLLDH